MHKNVFTYGSLMFERVWQQVVSGQYAACPVTLHGYQRFAVKQEEYPAAVPNPAQCITGILYFAVSPTDLARLDDFEGEYYERISVTVVNSNNGAFPAEIYVLNQAYQNILEAVEWDVDRFGTQGIEHFIARYQGFDQI